MGSLKAEMNRPSLLNFGQGKTLHLKLKTLEKFVLINTLPVLCKTGKRETPQYAGAI